MLNYTITDSLTKKLKAIGDLAAEKQAYLSSLDETCREFIKKSARVSNIGSSTRIENSILTDTEISWMDSVLSADGKPTAFVNEKKYFENKLSKDKERSIEEVVGCRSMLGIIFNQAEDLFPISQNVLCGLHRELLQFYPQAEYHLGKYKTISNNVVEKTSFEGREIIRDVFKTADPGPITEAAMYDLVDWYNETLTAHPWAAAVASEFVFRFLAVHPFQDGNGRLGRGLFALSILQSNEKNLKALMPFIAIDRHIEKNKQEYYLVLQRCSGGKFSADPAKYETQHFLTFMLKMLNDSVSNDIDHYANKYKAYVELADAPRKALDCFKEYPERKLALKDILSLTDIPRRTAIHAIGALVAKGFLQKYAKGSSAKYQLTF
jgi:Fic family protein